MYGGLKFELEFKNISIDRPKFIVRLATVIILIYVYQQDSSATPSC